MSVSVVASPDLNLLADILEGDGPRMNGVFWRAIEI
jgi:hypothetical protein